MSSARRRASTRRVSCSRPISTVTSHTSAWSAAWRARARSCTSPSSSCSWIGLGSWSIRSAPPSACAAFSLSPACTSLSSSPSKDVEPGPRGERARRPETRLGEPSERLVRVRRLHDRQGATPVEEAAERHAARAPHLDQRELSHVVLDGLALDEDDPPGPVEHDRHHLPRLDELAEAPRRIVGPHAAGPVRVFLDRVLELSGLLQTVEDVGGGAVG